MKTTDIGVDLCPECGAVADSATDTTGEDLPKEGDWTLCFRCCAALRFDVDIRMRALTPEEAADIPSDVREVQERLRAFRSTIKLPPQELDNA
jgi:hypothetical protein